MILRVAWVLDMARERRTRPHRIELLESISEGIKDKVETVTTDRLEAFVWAVKKAFPNAILIHYCFHLIWILNDAIDRARKREVKSHPELNGSRYAFLETEENRTKKQDAIFKVVQEANLQVSLSGDYGRNSRGSFNVNPSPKQRSILTSTHNIRG